MDMIIRNGTVVSATGSYKADVAVKDGKIAAVGSIPDIPGAKVVDAAGKLVLPGAIDAHTHLAMPFGGTVSSDDYFAGTRAAACGGTTTVFDFALQDFNETMTDTFNRRNALAAPDAAVDYSFHIGVKDIHGDLLDSIKDACDIGITSYKVFMVYDFGVKDGVFYQLLAKSKEFGALIAVHAENNELVNTLTEKYISEGKTDAWYHYMSRPEFVEGEADERAINLAKAANAPLYIVHLANKQGVEAVTKAKDEGYEIYAETCPQYLALDDGVYYDANWSMAARYVCAPPIRAEENQRALWRGLRRGEIQTISTDHCSFTLAQKDMGREDFTKIPGGLPGVETRGEVVYTRGVAAGRMTVAGMCRALCENPAKLYGLYPRKGVIAAGSDADIVVYDPKASHILSARDMVTKAGYTPFEGLRTEGGIAKVYLRGSLMVEDGRIVGGPEGQYLRRGLCTL